MHLAYDLLDGYDALVLVDALPGDGQPGSLVIMEVGSDDLGRGEMDAHDMNPLAVLSSLESMGGRLSATYVVGCLVEDVREGIGLSATVAAAVDAAVDAVWRLITERLLTDGPVAAAGRC